MSKRIDDYHESAGPINDYHESIERTCEALEAMVEQNQVIINELKKIVHGNTAIFDEIHVLRKIKEQEDARNAGRGI